MNFFKIYIFCLCITLALGVASYTMLYPYVNKITHLDDMKAELQTHINTLNSYSTSALDKIGAIFELIKVSLMIVATMLLTGPILVQKTVSMLGLPPELAFVIYVMNIIAFAGTVYNVLRGIRAVRW